MMTSRILLGVSLLVLLIESSFGYPVKGSQSSGQSFSAPAPQLAYSGHYEPVHYSTRPGTVPQTYPVFVQAPQLQAAPSGTFSSGSIVASVPDQSGSAVAYSAPGLPEGGQGALSFQSVPSMSSPVTPVVVVQGGVGPAQQGAPQAQMPETQWTVQPSTFEEEGPVSLSLSEVLPPAPLPPAGPVLQSGETSNILKEAELGNYQQQTEEFGYPADPIQPRVAFTSALPAAGLGGFPWWGATYPGFDYSLLYGLYPPGTYTTFSQNHERGKDYHQSIHYLKEHVSEDDGPQQTQQKVFPSGPKKQQFQ